MRVIIKSVCRQNMFQMELEVTPEMTVGALKEKSLDVQEKLGSPKFQQMTLVFLGKTLSDEKCLQDYGIKHGSIIHAAIKGKKVPNSSMESSTSSTNKSEENTNIGSLREELLLFLSKNNVQQNKAIAIVNSFMMEFKLSMVALSLDDIERLAKSRLQEEDEECFNNA